MGALCITVYILLVVLSVCVCYENAEEEKVSPSVTRKIPAPLSIPPSLLLHTSLSPYLVEKAQCLREFALLDRHFLKRSLQLLVQKLRYRVERPLLTLASRRAKFRPQLPQNLLHLDKRGRHVRSDHFETRKTGQIGRKRAGGDLYDALSQRTHSLPGQRIDKEDLVNEGKEKDTIARGNLEIGRLPRELIECQRRVARAGEFLALKVPNALGAGRTKRVGPGHRLELLLLVLQPLLGSATEGVLLLA